MTTRLSPLPILRIHRWQVEEWQNGDWAPSFTVQTWTFDHPLACRKARESAPALRKSRFKVTRIAVEDCDLQMMLSPLAVLKSPPPWLVPDLYGEYFQLALENRRARR